MFKSISFYVGKDTISLYGKEFPLGALSVEIINTPICETGELLCLLKQGTFLCEQFEGTKACYYLFRANQIFLQLETRLRAYPLLALLQQEQSPLWNTTVLHRKNWPVFRDYFSQFRSILNSILDFQYVITDFTSRHILPMESLSVSNLSLAARNLMEQPYFIFCSPVEKKEQIRVLSFPYSNNQPIVLDYQVQESPAGSGNFQITEAYTTDQLLMLLKIDFYRALTAGHIIRRCEYCGRYFLLTRAYHTKYCDNPAPDNPKYTCAQMGYRASRKKEKAKDDPKAEALRRCLQRITKDCSRGIITAEEKQRLKEKARDLYHQAKIRSGTSYEEFEKFLASEQLYPLCGVTRQTKPVGHPKKEAVRS